MILKQKLAQDSLISFPLPRPMGSLHVPDFLAVTLGPGDVGCQQKSHIRFSVLVIKLLNNCACPLLLLCQLVRPCTKNVSMTRRKRSSYLSHCLRQGCQKSLSTHIRQFREKLPFLGQLTESQGQCSLPQQSTAHPDQYSSLQMTWVTRVTDNMSQQTSDIGFFN